MNSEASTHHARPSAQRPLTILICDDHDIVHAGIEHLLKDHPDVRVVGHAKDGDQGVREFERLRPDVVLMDLSMPPGMGGIEATERINRLDGEAKVAVFTAHDSDFDVLRALEAGAKGFVLKNAPREELAGAITELAAGGSPTTPHVAAILVKQARHRPEVLTVREVEILQLVALGSTNQEIARRLNVSAGTVKGHLGAVFAKLGTNDRTNAVVRAYRQGLIRLDD